MSISLMEELADYLQVPEEFVDVKLREYHPELYIQQRHSSLVLSADVEGHSQGEIRFEIKPGEVATTFTEGVQWISTEFEAIQRELADFHWRNELQADLQRDAFSMSDGI